MKPIVVAPVPAPVAPAGDVQVVPPAVGVDCVAPQAETRAAATPSATTLIACHGRKRCWDIFITPPNEISRA